MNATIARLALRAELGQRRVWLLLAGPVLLVVAVLLTRSTSGSEDGSGPVGLAYAIVLPLVALLAANAVLGPELDDGSIIYLLAKPLSRHVMAVSKLVVAAGTSAVVSAVTMTAVGLLSRMGGAETLGLVVAAVLASIGYCALFLALAARGHGMVSGLLYVLVLESAVASAMPRMQHLSISALAGRIGRALAPASDTSPGLNLPGAAVELPFAVVALPVLVVASAWLAGRALATYQLGKHQ